MRVYFSPYSANCRKVRAIAAELEQKLELVCVDLLQRDQTRPDYVALNPNGRVPTLIDADFVLWESNAIMQYLCAHTPYTPLWPEDSAARADIARWQFWEAADFGPAVHTIVYETLFRHRSGLGEPNPAELDKGLTWFHRFAGVLDSHLERQPYLVGDRPTLADFSVVAPLSFTEAAELPLDSYSNVRAWRQRLEKRLSLRDAPIQLP